MECRVLRDCNKLISAERCISTVTTLPIFRSIGGGSRDDVLFTISALAAIASHGVGSSKRRRLVALCPAYTSDEVTAINCPRSLTN